MKFKASRASGATAGCVVLVLASVLSSLVLPACNLCSSREVREDVTLTFSPDRSCPSLEELQLDDPALDEGPTAIDVWTLRCCYDVVLSGTTGAGAKERCEEHEVASDWPERYLVCPSQEYRNGRPEAIAADAGADAAPEKIASVTSGPRQTRTPKERRCVYSKATGRTSADACG